MLFRYKIILKDKVPSAGDDKKKSTDLLLKYDKTKKEWQLGKTKVCGSSTNVTLNHPIHSIFDGSLTYFN